MGTVNTLNNFFNAKSIAVIGASSKRSSVGMKVFKNLIRAKFKGELYPVNPKHKKVQGYPCYSTVMAIPKHVDLAVITVPAHCIPKVINECGQKHIKAIIIISAGFSELGDQGRALEQEINTTANRYGIRFIGPNCLGVMRPAINMNATFDNNFAKKGKVALVSQSGALSAGILDWAMCKDIGFSAMLSIGNATNVGFGDILEYLAADPQTHSVLLYIEGIRNAPHFMEKLRACAKVKPVIIIKSGKYSQGVRAALSHTGALVGNDKVFDAAIRRAGAVRVTTIEELFSNAEILASNYKIKGSQLLILTNGGGAGVMTADYAAQLNIKLPDLQEKTICALNKVLPKHWSHHNPIDIIGDATPKRYHDALTLIDNEEIDAVLVILVPVAMTQPLKVARQIIEDAKTLNKQIFACWLGEKQVRTSWRLFEKNNIACFDTPEKAVDAFASLCTYQHNQALLHQEPKEIKFSKNNHIKSKKIIELALAEDRQLLTYQECKVLLQDFNIPTTLSVEAKTTAEAVAAANKVGYPVVMKINSPQITHKQDANGVALNVIDENAVKERFNTLIDNAKKYNPNASVLGITLEPMIHLDAAREVIVGILQDPVFGPVISFGAGGTLVELLQDVAVELPPLNKELAEELIKRTKVNKVLEKYRNMPEVNRKALVDILLRLSEMACELPQIAEMDINPLILNDKQAIAVDARIKVKSTQTKPYQHLAIQSHCLKTKPP